MKGAHNRENIHHTMRQRVGTQANIKVSNVRAERRATEYWILALYPFRVRSNTLLDGSYRTRQHYEN